MGLAPWTCHGGKKARPSMAIYKCPQKLFSRRCQLVQLLEQVAVYEGQLVEEVVDEISETCKGLSINAIRLTLLAQKKEKNIQT